MRIAIDLMSPALGGGETYIRNLIPQLAYLDKKNDYVLIIDVDSKIKDIVNQANFSFFQPTGRLPYPKFLWRQIFLPLYLKKAKIDLLLSPQNIGVFFTPTKSVLVLHNMHPFDSRIFRNESISQRIRLTLLHFIIMMSVNRTDKVIFLSKYSYDRFVIDFGVPQKKGKIIYLGKSVLFRPIERTETEKFITKVGLKYKDYIFCVSHIWRYKNLLELVEAFAKLKKEQPSSTQLAIAGMVRDKKYFMQIGEAIQQHQLEDDITFLGNIPHEWLPYLYCGCLFFVFPSTCENCPNVLIEALGCGIPILSSNILPMPEICGDAARYFDPYDVDDIFRNMISITDNKALRFNLKKKALERAGHFSWQKNAQEILGVFNEFVEDKSNAESFYIKAE